MVSEVNNFPIFIPKAGVFAWHDGVFLPATFGAGGDAMVSMFILPKEEQFEDQFSTGTTDSNKVNHNLENYKVNNQGYNAQFQKIHQDLQVAVSRQFYGLPFLGSPNLGFESTVALCADFDGRFVVLTTKPPTRVNVMPFEAWVRFPAPWTHLFVGERCLSTFATSSHVIPICSSISHLWSRIPC